MCGYSIPALDFDSGAQEPGETVEIAFPATGLVPGVLRHPSEDGALRRCRTVNATVDVAAVSPLRALRRRTNLARERRLKSSPNVTQRAAFGMSQIAIDQEEDIP